MNCLLMDAGIMGSNPTEGTDVYVYAVFVLSCVDSRKVAGSSPYEVEFFQLT